MSHSVFCLTNERLDLYETYINDDMLHNYIHSGMCSMYIHTIDENIFYILLLEISSIKHE